jgi:hypothetical protein
MCARICIECGRHTLRHTHTQTHIHTLTHSYTHTHINTHTQTHTYIHTHTHMHTQNNKLKMEVDELERNLKSTGASTAKRASGMRVCVCVSVCVCDGGRI